MSTVSSIGVPPGSRISRAPHGADFFDADAVSLDQHDRAALERYLRLIAATPAWVNSRMALRDRLVAPVHRRVVAAVLGRAPALCPNA